MSVQLIARGMVCVIAAALLASTGSEVNAQVAGRVPDADFVSLHPHEAKLPIDRLGSEVTPVAPLTLMNLLSCLTSLTLRNYPQAIAACDRAIVLDPDNAGGYKLRGEAYFFTARYEKAIADFKRSLSLDATDPETHSGLGATYRVLHAYAQATREFDRAIALAPDDERYLNGRCWTRAEWNHKLRLALADCSKALALAPDFASAYDSRGFVHLRLRQFERAVRDYDNAIGLNPSVATSYFGRGLARLHLRRMRDGRGDILKARSIDPDIDSFFAEIGVKVEDLRAPGVRPRSSPCIGTHCPPPGSVSVVIENKVARR